MKNDAIVAANVRPVGRDPFFSSLEAPNRPEALTENDVAGLLQVSVRTLQEWRSAGRTPPHWKVLHGKLIRYSRRLLLEWIDSIDGTPGSAARSVGPDAVGEVIATEDQDGLDEPVFKGGRRRKSIHPTFAQFLSTGSLRDEWLFVLSGVHQRPVDWIGSLDGDRDDAAPVVWLSLADYLHQLNRAADAQTAASDGDQLDGTMRHGKRALDHRI